LHAVEGGNLKVLQLLIEKGVDVTSKSVDGETAISKAEAWVGEEGDYEEMVSYLKSL